MQNIRLLTPAKIGPVEFKNRVIVSSMCLYFSGKNGEVTDKMIAFFENRAKAGTGAFIIPANPHGDNKRARGSLTDDSRIAQWKPLIDALHAQGAKAICQIHPSGIQFGRVGYAKSPFDLTTDEMKQLIESYAQGALRAKKAGFDAAEIHGAHGHEVAVLLSELLNKRTDQYGGSLENCARTVSEMIVRMKELCGKDFPVILRISAEERIPGGRLAPESLKICQIMEQAGVDAIHVSAGMPESEEWECPPSEIDQGHLRSIGKTMKSGLNVPVIVVGRIVDWRVGESMIENGEADFIAMGRTALADSQWAAAVGNDDVVIRKCIGCNQGCRTRREQIKGSMAACLQNPMLGHEEEIAITKDPVAKNVCVIGGGVSGLEAANIFSRRGHNVTVYERESQLGGLFRLASWTPGKKPYMNVIEYYEKILPKQGVSFIFDAAIDGVPAGEWDLIVFAGGGDAICPPIRVDNAAVVQATDFLKAGRVDADRYVVVGDGLVGYEIADYILERGKRPIVVGNDPREPITTQGIARWHFMEQRFKKANLEVIRHSTVRAIDANGLTVRTDDGADRRIDGKYEYILACGYTPAGEDAVKRVQSGANGVPVLVVGNAAAPGDAMDAIHDAFAKSVGYSFS
ncbi:MAG: FAD-dependent oxidoreductase [Planctomycetota bacterium]|nr:FAD-dependent oxidoreductase [Planctomycetota bacterium]